MQGQLLGTSACAKIIAPLNLELTRSSVKVNAP